MRRTSDAVSGKGQGLRLNSVSADKGSMVSVMSRGGWKALRRHRREEGQALVEFALILPLFVLLVAGIIQFGVGLNFWLDMQRIANQGARWAVVNKWPADPDAGGPEPGMSGACLTSATTQCTQTLQAYLGSQPNSRGLTPCVEILFPNTTKAPGDPVKVVLSSRYTFVPILNLGRIKLAAEATMRLEQLPGRYTNGLGGTNC